MLGNDGWWGNTEAGSCWGEAQVRAWSGSEGSVGNFPFLIISNGESLWILEQRKTVFKGDNSSSCVEDGERPAGKPARAL